MSADRPTPETDASRGYALTSHYGRSEGSCLQMNRSGPFVHADVARKLEREREEAREIAKKYEDRYFTMSELRNNASIVALQYKAQRDRLVEALKRVIASATPNPRDNPAMYPVWELARAAIAEVEGGR